MSREYPLRRRRFLTLATTGLTVGVSGCSGPARENATTDQASRDEADGDENDEGDEDNGDDPATLEYPRTGEAVPELEALEEVLLEYMDDVDATAATLGLARDGTVIYERGFGWADEDRTIETQPDALFRIGSVSKSITDAGIERLVDTGELAYDDTVYPLLEVDAPAGEPADERIHDIEVGHLLEHSGGWDLHGAGDPMFDPLTVADELDLAEPPTPEDFVRYILEQPLQFDPGEQTAYSNVGYCVLGRVIEGISGQSYHSYIEEAVLEPAGVDDVSLGRTKPAERDPREVWYDDPAEGPNAIALEEDELVPYPDGAFSVELLDAAGGHIASTAALLEFADAYWLDGTPRDEQSLEYVVFGSMPGSFAIVAQHPDGVDLAALFNRRAVGSELIADRLFEAVEGVETWP